MAARSRSGSSEAALGFRAHSGWAAMVAVAGTLAEPVVLMRRRVELVADPPSRQPFHAAVGLAPERAATLIRRSTDTAQRLAGEALRGAVAELKRGGHGTVACGLLVASNRPLPALPQILASHALIHAAEGELFREAVRGAAGRCGLEVVAVKEKELMERASAALAVEADELKRRLDGMRRTLGPPWRQDEKLATLVAWLSLRSRRPPLSAAGP